MKLYTNPLSPNCRKVHALAKHLGLQLEVETMDIRNNSTKEPEYLAMNPNGKIPTLMDGNRSLWESNVIMAYLASKQDSATWPKSEARYEIMKWMSWESCHFAPPVSKIISQVIFAPMRGGTPDQAIIDQGLQDFRKYGAVANGQLEKTKFLTGDQPTIADFAVAVWLSYEQICKLPVSEYTHLSRWWKDMQALQGGSELLAPAMR
jgi:glutathione S-transferase